MLMRRAFGSLARNPAEPDHSAAGESTLVDRLVAEFECVPFVVDVGAHDGRSASNTRRLVEAGWPAILIEPLPAPFEKLRETYHGYPHVTCLCVACADQPGQAELYIGTDGEQGFLSTLCRDDNAWFQAMRSDKSIEVDVDTLTNLLMRHSAPREFGVLSIDAEGMDYEVLLGLDFARYRPTIVITEEYESDREKHASKYALLIREGYSLVQKVGANTIWRLHTAQRRGSPPGITDDAVRKPG